MNDHKNRLDTTEYTDPLTASEQENEFLQEQADEAKAAIGNALSEAKSALATGMDPKAWTRKYPLIAVGSALVAGFAAAAVTISSKEERELAHLRKVHEAMHPEPAPAASAGVKPGFWSSVIREAVEMIRPVLTTALLASFKGPPSNQQPSSPPSDPPTSG
jgi:hypothetical protein